MRAAKFLDVGGRVVSRPGRPRLASLRIREINEFFLGNRAQSRRP